jgi:hypothetical protein
MPVIHVVKPFIFQHNPKQTGEYKDEKTDKMVPVFALEGERQLFHVGLHDVPDHIAQHWYVQAHLEGYEAPAPLPAQPDYSYQMKALQAARAGRNTTSVAEAAPPAAPLPPGVQAPERHYFAGTKIADQPAPELPAWMKGG